MWGVVGSEFGGVAQRGHGPHVRPPLYGKPSDVSPSVSRGRKHLVYKDHDVSAVRNDHGEAWEVGVRSSKWVVWGTGSVDREERTCLREWAAGRLAGFVG